LNKDNVEERLRSIESKLEEVLRALSRIEEVLSGNIGDFSVLSGLMGALGLPPLKAAEAALRLRRALMAFRSNLDPTARAVVEALASGEWMSISEITRVIKALRGRASRTTVRRKVELLEKAGLVEVKRERGRTLVRLRV